jgi:hypothetical protein
MYQNILTYFQNKEVIRIFIRVKELLHQDNDLKSMLQQLVDKNQDRRGVQLTKHEMLIITYSMRTYSVCPLMSKIRNPLSPPE